MKKILLAGFIFGLLFTTCIDSDYPFVDGQWQLKTITEDGVEQKVDTVFYNFMFKRDVFAYVVLLPSDMNSLDESYVFYGYIDSITDDELVITMDEGFFNAHFMMYSDWREKQRKFEVLKMNSKEMVLFYGNKTYSFKKY